MYMASFTALAILWSSLPIILKFSTNVVPIKRIFHKQKHQKDKTNKKKQHQSLHKMICHMLVPYSQGISEGFKNICKKYEIQVHFTGGKPLKIY